MNGEETGQGFILIEDEKVIAIGAFDFFDGKFERIGSMKVVNGAIEVFFGAVGFFDCESVESFGVDDADNFFFAVDDWKIGEAGFVELVKDEGAEDFFIGHENHFGFRNHEVVNSTVVETHDGSNAVTVLAAQDAARGALQDGDKILESFRCVFGRGGIFMLAIFFELGVKETGDFLAKIEPHDIIYCIIKELL